MQHNIKHLYADCEDILYTCSVFNSVPHRDASYKDNMDFYYRWKNIM